MRKPIKLLGISPSEIDEEGFVRLGSQESCLSVKDGIQRYESYQKNKDEPKIRRKVRKKKGKLKAENACTLKNILRIQST